MMKPCAGLRTQAHRKDCWLWKSPSVRASPNSQTQYVANPWLPDHRWRELARKVPNVVTHSRGENDGTDANPGWQNAEKLAQELADDLGRPILSTRVPEDVRDTRDYLKSKFLCDYSSDDTTFADVGTWYAEEILASAQLIRPQGVERFEMLDLAALMALKEEHRWLIEGVLAANQPCVIGGPKKSLKTSVAIAMAISIATGTDFLGEFVTRGKRPVGIFSAESGRITLRDLAKRLLERLGASCPSYENIPLHMCFDVPKFSDESDLKALAYYIRQHHLEVVIIDPLYLCALAGSKSGDASNMYHMGPLFRQAAEACLTAGATPIFVHHSRKAPNSPKDKWSKFAPPDLDDLAFAGISEFARQWLLLSRREAYVPHEGVHRLWMSVGGSAFGGRIHGLTVEEGECDNKFEGRKWITTVESYDDIAAERKERRVEAQEAKEEDTLQRMLDALQSPEFADGATISDLRKKGLGKLGIAKALQTLTTQGKLEQCQVTKNAGPAKRKYPAHRLVQPKLLPKVGRARPVLKLRGPKQTVAAREEAIASRGTRVVGQE